MPYGGNIYGVEEASKAFFGVDASAHSMWLKLHISLRFRRHRPIIPLMELMSQRLPLELILPSRKMEAAGYITSDQYTQALNEKVTFLPSATQSIKAPHFVLYVIQYLEQK